MSTQSTPSPEAARPASTPQDHLHPRRRLGNLLGRLPDRHRPLGAELVRTEETGDYLLEELRLDLNGLEPVPAYFVRPRALSAGARPLAPAVLYHHAHGSDYQLGKTELIAGRAALQPTPYAVELTRRGWCVLAIDAWNFGARHRRTESSLFKEMLWRGRVLWGMMLYDAVRALDYLTTRPEIDPGRIATLGMSMGSTLSWWLAALDERVKVCADICCLTDFHALVEEDGLDRHGLYYYVPGLLEEFTTADINALIAPRPHLSVAGLRDRLTPPAGLDRIDAALKEVYAAHGAPDAWRLLRYDCGHQETPEMREEVLRWLDRWL